MRVNSEAGKRVAVERLPCLRLNVPELFLDPLFAEWVGNRPGVATWHVEGEMGECSDVFVTYDNGCGSDAEDMPEHCWEYIRKAVELSRVQFALIWLTNLDD